MRVAVCIPWRETPERVRAFRWVAQRWRDLYGWPVVAEDAPTSYWSKAAAVNRTVDRAVAEHRPDVLVIADADLVLLEPVETAERALLEGWAVGHDRALRLTKAASARLLATPPDVPLYPDHVARSDVRRSVPALLGDGALAITPMAWEFVGGMDERFREWGHQQVALGHACRTLLGPAPQPDLPTLHFDHDSGDKERKEHPFYEANTRLARRYSSTRTANGMARLVSEPGRRPSRAGEGATGPGAAR